MGTTMHRLQISLPPWQAEYLAERAKRDGVSMAELVRRLIASEAERHEARSPESVWQIVGIASDALPLIDETPVSERPDLYLAEALVTRSHQPDS